MKKSILKAALTLTFLSGSAPIYGALPDPSSIDTSEELIEYLIEQAGPLPAAPMCAAGEHPNMLDCEIPQAIVVIPFQHYPKDFNISRTPQGADISWSAADEKAYELFKTSDIKEWQSLTTTLFGKEDHIFVLDDGPLAEKSFYKLRLSPIRPNFDTNDLPKWDDYIQHVPIGFLINLITSGTSQNFGECWINDNGNISFGDGIQAYRPVPLQRINYEDNIQVDAMIAPFWGDVDTSHSDSRVAQYGYSTIDGKSAFGVTWVDVGFYQAQASKLNSFQVVLISRNDISPGAFDIEFNYGKISWESGLASGGPNGYGGFPARMGITDGFQKSVELNRSGTSLEMLDFHPETFDLHHETGLIYSSYNSDMPGRFVFEYRNGKVANVPQISAGGFGQGFYFVPIGANSVQLNASIQDPTNCNFTVTWSLESDHQNVTISNPNSLKPIITFDPNEKIPLQHIALSISAESDACKELLFRDTAFIIVP